MDEEKLLDFVDQFLKWEGWTAVNSLSQMFIALLALVAICITLNQVGNRKQYKIDLEVDIKEPNDQQIMLELFVFNFGIAPLYIRNCWVWDCKSKNNKKKERDLFVIEINIKRDFIAPGQGKLFESQYINKYMWEQMAFTSFNNLYLFIQNSRGKIKRKKIDPHVILRSLHYKDSHDFFSKSNYYRNHINKIRIPLKQIKKF